MKKFDVAFKDISRGDISRDLSLLFQGTYQPTEPRRFPRNYPRIDPKATLVVAASDLPSASPLSHVSSRKTLEKSPLSFATPRASWKIARPIFQESLSLVLSLFLSFPARRQNIGEGSRATIPFRDLGYYALVIGPSKLVEGGVE